MAKAFSYNKKEKLKGRKSFELLFTKGKSLVVFPVKVFYLQPLKPVNNNVKAGVGASSRTFKKAVQRNRIKRLLREAYRLHKLPLHDFLQQHQQQLIVFFLYIDKTLPLSGQMLQAKMPVIINELIKKLNEPVLKNT